VTHKCPKMTKNVLTGNIFFLFSWKKWCPLTLKSRKGWPPPTLCPQPHHPKPSVPPLSHYADNAAAGAKAANVVFMFIACWPGTNPVRTRFSMDIGICHIGVVASETPTSSDNPTDNRNNFFPLRLRSTFSRVAASTGDLKMHLPVCNIQQIFIHFYL
jgi:hypothetical protein